MDLRSTFAAPADGRFERVVCALVLREPFGLEALGPDVAIGRARAGGPRLAIVRNRPGVPLPPLDDLAEVVLVGGSVQEHARPSAKLLFWHLDESGAAHGADADRGDLHPLVERADTPPDWAAFWQELESRSRAGAEITAFQQVIAGRRPTATWSLLASIAAVYAFGAVWGAPDHVPALTRMGALDGDRVLDGEVWRLLASTLLHGDLAHIAANSYVLWSFSRLERVIGSARFLTIYVVSGLIGSLAMMTAQGGGVGASGAIWGLLGTELVLAWRGHGVLPRAVMESLRSTALQNLMLNVGISLFPGIGWSAHFGGGLAGAALTFAGAATWGLPRLGSGTSADVVPFPMKASAVASAVALAGSIVAAVVFGRPWEVDDPPRWIAQEVAPGWVADTPEARPVGDATFGDLAADPAAFAIRVEPRADAEPLVPDDPTVGAAEAGYTAWSEPLRSVVDGGNLVQARFARGPDLAVQSAVYARADRVVQVEVALWTRSEAAWEGVAARIATSVHARAEAPP